MASVVVVDDEPVIADVLAAALGDEGYSVTIARHGAAALERLAELPQTDLVVSDLIMPVLDGAGLLRAMRGCPQHRDIPVILMSSMPEAHARHAGDYTAFLRKPFQLANVIALVARVLSEVRLCHRDHSAAGAVYAGPDRYRTLK